MSNLKHQNVEPAVRSEPLKFPREETKPMPMIDPTTKFASLELPILEKRCDLFEHINANYVRPHKLAEIFARGETMTAY